MIVQKEKTQVNSELINNDNNKIFHLYLKKAVLVGSILPLQKPCLLGKQEL